MLKVTIIGTGGKMGLRLTDNLMSANYQMSYLEVSPEGIERLKEMGILEPALSETFLEAVVT